MQVTSTRRFNQQVKKMHKAEKKALDNAVKQIIKNPAIGEKKKGKLSKLCVYKYKVKTQLYLLGYSLKEEEIVLIEHGTHENFYRDLER